MALKAFVTFKDYNGFKNVKFVMKQSDVAFRKTLSDIDVISVVDVVKGEFTHNGVAYKVHSDSSVSQKG